MNGAKPIIVGVQNDERDEHVLAAADKPALKVDAPLLLVHAYENEVANYGTIGIGIDLIELIGAMGDFNIHQARTRLENTASKLKAKSQVKVLSGPPAQNLIAEAISSEAWLIMVGSRPGGHRLKWRSLSVALSLFNGSPIPVMVVNDNTPLRWTLEKGIKVIAADDLSKVGGGPTPFAAELTERGGEGSTLDVFHVNPLSEAALASGIESALASSYSQPTSPLNPTEIYDALARSLESKLCQQVPTELKKKIAWVTHLITGSPERELIEIIQRDHPHIAVFGKHKAVHRKPFYFGKLPFSAAFELDLPFVVVPG